MDVTSTHYCCVTTGKEPNPVKFLEQHTAKGVRLALRGSRMHAVEGRCQIHGNVPLLRIQ
jgi:hypothetical protein